MNGKISNGFGYALTLMLVLGSWGVAGAQDEVSQDCDASCCNSCGIANCCDCCGTWLDNTVLFLGSDAWKNIGDSDYPNNFGYRMGANTGFALGSSRIRGQIGASYGAYDLQGHAARPNFDTVEQQFFVTGGIYKRSNILRGDRLAWGVVYDYMHDTAWNGGIPIDVGQLRWKLGYARDASNEFGVWGANRVKDDVLGVLPGSPIYAINQVNAFWHHNWQLGGDTTVYIGYAERPNTWVIGVDGQVPLSRCVSLYASTTYFVGDGAAGSYDALLTDTWNVSVGLSWSFGCKTINRTVSGDCGMPLLNVADNGSFGIHGGLLGPT